jgi:hypothetical protein
MTLAWKGYTPKHDVAQKFLPLDLVSSQLRHFHHRSRRKVQWLDRRRTHAIRVPPISDKIHKQGDYHPNASNACSAAHTCGSNVMHLNMWVSHGWIRDCSRICRCESNRLQHVSTMSGAEAATIQFKASRIHTFSTYKLQQAPKSGSGGSNPLAPIFVTSISSHQFLFAC